LHRKCFYSLALNFVLRLVAPGYFVLDCTNGPGLFPTLEIIGPVLNSGDHSKKKRKKKGSNQNPILAFEIEFILKEKSLVI